MEFESPQVEGYLHALFTATEGNVETIVSMYEIGIPLGLERTDAGSLAEELMVEGLVELKNLSGGVSITPEGLKALDIEVAGTAQQNVVVLGEEVLLSVETRQSVEQLVTTIKAESSALHDSYERLEELVIDLKSLEVQLLSARPKTSIVREILRSIAASLETATQSKVASQINTMISG